MSDSLIVKLGADTSDFKGQVAGAASSIKNEFGEKAGGETGQAFGRAFERKVGLQDAFKSMFATIGIDIKNIAETIARALTFMSEQTEDLIKKTNELTDSTLAKYQEIFKSRAGNSQAVAKVEAENTKLYAEQARINDEINKRKQVYLDLAARQAKAEEAADYKDRGFANAAATSAKDYLILANQITASDKEQARIKEIENLLAENGKIIEQERARVVAEAANKEQQIFERRQASLPLAIQISNVEKRIADSQKEINEFKGAGVDLDVKKAILKQNELLLETAIQKRVEEGNRRALELDDERFQYMQKNRELLELQAKDIAGKILPAEKARLEILKLQVKEQQNQTSIGYILAKEPKDRTQSERETLAALELQNKQLDEQIKKYQIIIEKTKDVTKTAVEGSHILDGIWGGKGADVGATKLLSGFATYNDPGEQAEYEKNLVAQAKAEIGYEIADLQNKLDMYQKSGSSLGNYEIPGIRARIQALQGRAQNVQSFVFDPNYSDAAGKGIFASQVSTIGDPLKLQTQQTDAIKQVAQGVDDLNNRLRTNGFQINGG